MIGMYTRMFFSNSCVPPLSYCEMDKKLFGYTIKYTWDSHGHIDFEIWNDCDMVASVTGIMTPVEAINYIRVNLALDRAMQDDE